MKRKGKKLAALTLPDQLQSRVGFEPPDSAFARWNPALRAASDDDAAGEIGIFGTIGSDVWDEDVTSKRIAAALRRIGADNPVTVNVNSPGGHLDEGVAIYNLLREHRGDVTVKVVGIAASAASIIAMAGDRIEIGRAAFLMIHNTWAMAIGNRNDFRDFAAYLEPFDLAMADVYAARTEIDTAEISALMDAETWIGGSRAVEDGWADALLPADQVSEGDEQASGRTAQHKIDVALAKYGYTRSERRALFRSERRRLLSEFKSSTPCAAGTGTPSATGDTPRAVLEVEPLPRLSFPGAIP